ncbi:unnamed protein product [Haemonchus placei]|uniref:Myosin_tail_1 domain-containing protein n=1 Tax=Haemonchus placei TaxID=6290 RepID=A0A0N4WJD0_HAEPC|nr:unnamed protein product [Haemonchus placei]
MDSIQKSLEGLSLEEKVTKLVKRLADSEEHNVKLKEKAAQVEKLTKANSALEKKLEKANQILLKTEDAKGKLEELCRELQRMNKQIREDSLNKVRLLEHERHQAVEQLRGALKYKEKDNYWQEYNKAKDIEIKLLKTKLEAAEILAQKSALEKEELTRTFVEGTARIGGALENEKALREEVGRILCSSNTILILFAILSLMPRRIPTIEGACLTSQFLEGSCFRTFRSIKKC